jgi:hypothetical protein
VEPEIRPEVPDIIEIPVIKVENPEEEGPVTSAMKRSLISKISKLNDKRLTKTVALIEELCSTYMSEQDPDHVIIHIDDFDL